MLGTPFLVFRPTTLEIAHKCVSVQNTNAHEVLRQPEIFYISKPYLFLHTYDLSSIPHLADHDHDHHIH